jgi:hypothetical protein
LLEESRLSTRKAGDAKHRPPAFLPPRSRVGDHYSPRGAGSLRCIGPGLNTARSEPAHLLVGLYRWLRASPSRASPPSGGALRAGIWEGGRPYGPGLPPSPRGHQHLIGATGLAPERAIGTEGRGTHCSPLAATEVPIGAPWSSRTGLFGVVFCARRQLSPPGPGRFTVAGAHTARVLP